MPGTKLEEILTKIEKCDLQKMADSELYSLESELEFALKSHSLRVAIFLIPRHSTAESHPDQYKFRIYDSLISSASGSVYYYSIKAGIRAAVYTFLLEANFS